MTSAHSICRPVYIRILLAVSISALASVPLIAQGVEPSPAKAQAPVFRVEKVPVAGGAEIVTIFARKDGPDGDLPLVSVLRDTLGDGRPENDKLRYVWLHSFARPSTEQKAAALVPFLYARTANKTSIDNSPPPPLIDLNRPAGSGGWDTLFWQVFKRVVLDDAGRAIKATALQYRQNKDDHRRTAIATALAVLSVYQETGGENVLSDQELRDIQAKLSLNGKLLGAHMQSENFERAYIKDVARTRDERAQNWELLRQACEREGLFFQPLKMPDGTARHAIVWVAAEELQRARERKFDARFLNIKDPYSDKTLPYWKGFSETRWYDADDREVAAGTPGGTKRTLIPLAVYGLDNPKIPAILVDFRNNTNPKAREISRRVLSDIVNNVLSIGRFSSLPFFLGRYAYDFVTSRRGMDVNQDSRLRSYAQLKLLIKLDDSLRYPLRSEIADRVEAASLNPLENDTDVEETIARAQYRNLMAFAADENGLAARLSYDRREEMVRLKHGMPARMLFSLGHFATLGTYTHRERSTPELLAAMDTKRQLEHHERVVRQIALRTNDPAIDSNMEQLRASLSFLSDKGADAAGKTAKALAKIFNVSDEADVRSLCLAGLYKINSMSAKRELLAIYQNHQNEEKWRDSSAHYLKLAVVEGQRMSKRDVQTVAGILTSIN